MPLVWDPERVIAQWSDREELAHHRVLSPREARYGTLSVHPLVEERLRRRGIDALYLHQAQAISQIRKRRNVVMAIGTAGGKSLAFQIPVVERVLEEPRASALFIYPTKALAQDQLRSLQTFELPVVGSAVYDGDTPQEDRAELRRRTNVILTNPDMLHVGILPSHQRWADFFHRLEYVVVDEVHHLRGVFGTHVAFILRRLRRLCRLYGSEPTFILASATIGNPGDLAHQLTGLEMEVIADDYSPAGERRFALWNPSLTDPELGLRRSALSDATEIFAELIREGGKVIAFARGRKSTELMYKWAGSRLDREQADAIAPYRAGYTPQQRRNIERRLFGGELAGVIATNALELGIDVGGLDATVITTFPGTMAAFRQQAGRAGRRGQPSLAVLVAGEDALDQYLIRHPDEVFSRPSEAVVINPNNAQLAQAHTACAAYEHPLELGDREILGPAMEEAANRLVQDEHLRLKDGRLFWSRRSKPAPAIDLRSGGGPAYLIIDRGNLLGTLDPSRVNRDAHPGAIYLHQGDSYLVEAVDHPRREISVRRTHVDYYTQTKVETDLAIADLEMLVPFGPNGVNFHLGMVEVEYRVDAYQRRKLRTRELIETTPLDLPSSQMVTAAVWMTLPDRLIADLDHDLLGSLHAAEHAGIALLPLMAVCDRWDIGGLSTNWHPDTGVATIFIHEGYPGGAGIAPIAFDRREKHWVSTRAMIRECPCLSGCPSCVQSPKCGNLNEPLAKAGAVQLLDLVLA